MNIFGKVLSKIVPRIFGGEMLDSSLDIVFLLVNACIRGCIYNQLCDPVHRRNIRFSHGVCFFDGCFQENYKSNIFP